MLKMQSINRKLVICYAFKTCMCHCCFLELTIHSKDIKDPLNLKDYLEIANLNDPSPVFPLTEKVLRNGVVGVYCIAEHFKQVQTDFIASTPRELKKYRRRKWRFWRDRNTELVAKRNIFVFEKYQ